LRLRRRVHLLAVPALLRRVDLLAAPALLRRQQTGLPRCPGHGQRQRQRRRDGLAALLITCLWQHQRQRL
jgi:hypothetical protein